MTNSSQLTTTLAYRAVGTAGALAVASVDGPLTNDTVTYSHDAPGRVTGRQLAGSGWTLGYDALGRPTTLTHALGDESRIRLLATNQRNDGGHDPSVGVARQEANTPGHEIAVRREQLSRACVAGDTERTGGKGRGVEHDGGRIAVGLAGDLAEHVVAPAGIGENDGWPKLGL